MNIHIYKAAMAKDVDVAMERVQTCMCVCVCVDVRQTLGTYY